MRRTIGRLAAGACVVYVLYLCDGVVLGTKPAETAVAAGVTAGLFVIMDWASKRARRSGKR